MTKTRLAITAYVLGLIIGGALVANAVQYADGLAAPGVTGIGGVFFKARDPAELRAWYERHLDIGAAHQGVNFFWRDRDDASRFGLTVWSLFPRDTDYFGPGDQGFMINYRVADLETLLDRLREQGVSQVGEIEEYWYGRFAWILDGEGNRVELWEPVDFSPEEFIRRSQAASSR